MLDVGEFFVGVGVEDLAVDNCAGAGVPSGDESVVVGEGFPRGVESPLRDPEDLGVAVDLPMPGSIAERIPVVAEAGEEAFFDDGAVGLFRPELVEDGVLGVDAGEAAGLEDPHPAVSSDLPTIRVGWLETVFLLFAGDGGVEEERAFVDDARGGG